MRISFTAFAEDSVIRGELVLEGDRLSDFIPQDGPFDIERVMLEALEDGRQVSTPRTTIARSDLIAIAGSGPRGNAARRVRTRPHPARAQAGPYEIVGYMHAPPSAHPFSGVLRRGVLPMTSAVIRYRIANRMPSRCTTCSWSTLSGSIGSSRQPTSNSASRQTWNCRTSSTLAPKT